MIQNSENYKFYLNITRGTFRMNVKKYEQYLNEKKFTTKVKIKKPLGIQKTVTP